MLNSNEILRCDFFSEDECKNIIEYIENKKKFLQNQSFENNQNTKIYDLNSQITTNFFDKYNFFHDNPQYIDRFVQTISNMIPNIEFPIAVQSWCNIYEKGESIKPHNHHGLSFYSYAANIFIGGSLDNQGITYMEPGWKQTIKNRIGEMHIFDCFLWHTVPPNISEEKRYSIGITIHSFEAITKELLHGSCFNSKYKEIILLSRQ